jgi:uncharacterized protein YecE (DUF72 family)
VNTDVEHNLHVGPAGWHYDDWDGVVYPLPRPRGFDPLAYLASYFNLIEINSTFYHTPAAHVCRRWLERVRARPDFQFTVKAHQALTHRRGPEASAELPAVLRAVEPFADAGRLGAVLLQFPWSFRFDADARAHVDALLDAFAGTPVAVEVRHGSWESPAAAEYFAGRSVTVCGIDQPVIGDSLHPYHFQAGRAGAYFRLHGRNYREWFAADAGRDARYDYLYTEGELIPWVDVVRGAAQGGTPAFVVLNNHFRGKAPANAFAMAAMLLGRPLPAPTHLRKEYPQIEAWTVAADHHLGARARDLFGG